MTNHDPPATGAALVRAAPLLPVDVSSAQQAMNAYQELTRRLLTEADWIGTPGAPGSFVKRSGWQKIATFYGVSTELRERQVERDDDGRPVHAYVLARAIAQNGRMADGDGACAANEPRFRSASGRQKVEHDLPATAATRATNRAISNLVGFGAVSAEEADADVRAGATGQPAPDWAADIPEAAVDRFGENLAVILTTGAAAGGDWSERAALEVANRLATFCDGTVPAACARLAHLLARELQPNPAPGVAEPADAAVAGPPAPHQEGAA